MAASIVYRSIHRHGIVDRSDSLETLLMKLLKEIAEKERERERERDSSVSLHRARLKNMLVTITCIVHANANLNGDVFFFSSIIFPS